jgi:transposase InsO family protein
VTEKYEFIDGEKVYHPVRKMCDWLGVSSSGFYAWRSRPISATAERREELEVIIRHIFDESDGTYGYRRIHAALTRMDVQVGPELVRGLMRKLDLVPCQPRPWRTTTIPAEDALATPDLVNRDFTAHEPGRNLIGDIA